jgi:hypothetical protein
MFLNELQNFPIYLIYLKNGSLVRLKTQELASINQLREGIELPYSTLGNDFKQRLKGEFIRASFSNPDSINRSFRFTFSILIVQRKEAENVRSQEDRIFYGLSDEGDVYLKSIAENLVKFPSSLDIFTGFYQRTGHGDSRILAGYRY